MASKPTFYIPSLDGIRTFAFFIVFLAHAGLSQWIPGGFGVTIFFFLSGYLITTLIRREHEKFGNLNFKLFYARRLLRIWPPFYFILIGATLLTWSGLSSGQLDLPSILAQFLHFANYGMVAGWENVAVGTEVYWSLAVEEHFYLIFPWFYIFLIRRGLTPKQQALVMWGICALILLWRCILVFGFHSSAARTYYATDTRIDSILFGCILAVYGNPVLDQPVDESMTDWKRILLPIGCGVLAFSLIIRSPEFRETFRYTLQGIALFPIFVVAIREPEFGIFRWLNVAWIRFLGLLSYSLYLVHIVVIGSIYYWFPQLHPPLRGSLALGLSVLIALLIYTLIEQPIAQMRKHLVRNQAESVSRKQELDQSVLKG